MSDLPQGWAATQLGELASSIVGGGTPSKSNADYFRGTVPFMTVKDMHARFILDTQDHITEEALVDSASRLIPADTLVVASRMSLGKIARPTVPVAINQDLKAIFLHEGIDKTYVEYAWRTKESDIQGMGTGTTVKGIRLEDIRGLDIALAPSGEQIRIANQLDTLLARVQACNDRFDAIPALLKRFRQTVLDAATTGALTQDWRDAQSKTAHKSLEPEWAKTKALHALPSGWRWARFSEFLSGFRSGTSAVPSSDPSVYPVLRSSSVRPMGVDFEDVRHLPNLTKVRADDLLVEGDVLFTRLSGSLEYVANCAVVRGLGDRKIYYPDRLFRARLIRPEQGTYFELCFASPLLRKHLTVEAKSTAGHQRISMGAVTDFPIPMPPDDEQAEIVRRVEALFALADRIEARCTAARAQAQRLTPLVLAKAFRGELVQQNPNDEPASALLARIASSNTAVAQKNRRKAPVAFKRHLQAAINL